MRQERQEFEALKRDFEALKGDFEAARQQAGDARQALEALRGEFDAYRQDAEAMKGAIDAYRQDAEAMKGAFDATLRDAARQAVREAWRDHSGDDGVRGVEVPAPPRTEDEGRMSVAEIMAIEDDARRERAIAENHRLFGF